MTALPIDDRALFTAPRTRVVWLAALTGALGVLAVVMRWSGTDLAAQVFRADLVRTNGFVLWNSNWYGGHPTLDYSVISPVLGALFGPLVIGALSWVGSAILFDRLVARHFGARSWVGSLWFAVGYASNLAVGRVTFSVGVTFALGALLLLDHRRPGFGALVAAATSLTSPVAGVFLLVALGAVFLGSHRERWRAAAVGAGAFVPLAIVALVYPSTGSFPYEYWAYGWTLAVCAACFLAARRRSVVLRNAIVLYAALATFALVVPSALGANVPRLPQYVAGPLLACLLWQHHRRILAAAAIPLLLWQLYPAYDGIVGGRSDIASKASYYQPIIEYLRQRTGVPGRVEVLPTQRHWESVYLALDVPIARGWQRQLDMSYDKVFYDGTLGPATYRQWLIDNAVEFVAVPAVKLDASAVQERALVQSGLPYLRPVLKTKNWSLWKVLDYKGLVTGPATMRTMKVSSFTLDVQRNGATVVVRQRWSTHWSIDQRGACAAATRDGWLELRNLRRGPVTVSQSLIGSGC